MIRNYRSEQLREVFEDTRAFIEETPALKHAEQYGIEHTVFIPENEYPIIPEQQKKRAGEIRISKYRTLQSARYLHREYPGQKIAVLNFASAVKPGGGVLTGARAQEESICRCSTLYEALNQKRMRELYYDVNAEKGDPLYTDACIYTPDVMVCKTDTELPERLSPEEFCRVDIVTCAAPRLLEGLCRDERETPEELEKLYLRRIHHILHVMAAKDAEIVILGAFGCGVFHNNPALVASAFESVLGMYGPWFDLVEFAVFCNEGAMENYNVFRRFFGSAQE